MKFQKILLVAAATIVAMTACQPKGPEPAQEPQALAPIVLDTVEEEPEPVVEAKPVVRHAAKPKVKAETHYVSSYDSKGPVWGHVTMTGDKGTGVIHDSDENTYSVTCTRHGNELFAVDQNSRRYVFKLGE